MPHAVPTVFIPALLCNDALYSDVIAELGDQVDAQVMLSPRPVLADSVADILARAPHRFALVSTSYGGGLALEIALAAPERVTALWLMGCDPGPPPTGGPDLPAALESTPEAVFDMLAGLVVHPDATGPEATFKAMAAQVGGAAGAAQARALGGRVDNTARLAELTMPVLVLWGSDDAIVPVSVGQAMASSIPHAHFHQLAGCGHLPTLERPAESAALFAAFLQAEPAPAA